MKLIDNGAYLFYICIEIFPANTNYTLTLIILVSYAVT